MTELNYNPADPDKMQLPKGKTCGDCAHIRRCTAIFGHTEKMHIATGRRAERFSFNHLTLKAVTMQLINRSKQSPLGRRACEAALAEHYQRFGEYGRQKCRTNYTVAVDGVKVTVEVVNRATGYVATAMTGARRLRNLAWQSK